MHMDVLPACMSRHDVHAIFAKAKTDIPELKSGMVWVLPLTTARSHLPSLMRLILTYANHWLETQLRQPGFCRGGWRLGQPGLCSVSSRNKAVSRYLSPVIHVPWDTKHRKGCVWGLSGVVQREHV